MYSLSRKAVARPQSSSIASPEPFWKPKQQLVFHGNTVSNGQDKETTVAPPQSTEDEETTVPDGGVVPLQAAPAFFQCTPTSAAIKNVKKYTKGKLYGHEFDFVVDLSYSKLGMPAIADDDAKLEWWEKTDRPPSWQTTVKKDTWNDMFVHVPNSPLFDNWKNRTKPVPGKETVTLHDPPAASVDMPARTLEFNLKVTGGGTTVSATGKQVLEPDGKGGIKTQTFT
jgi:hypothetical protein